MYNKVCIIGTGKMAENIALFLLSKKIDILFTSSSDDRLDAFGLTFIKKYKRLVRVEGESTVGKYNLRSLKLIENETFDLAIESTSEDLNKKTSVINKIIKLFPDLLILSNSSSINPIDINPRVVAVHFFYSVDLTKFVEIINDKENKAKKFVSELGLSFIEEDNKKQFIVNRLLLPLQAEALRLLQSGYGSDIVNSSSASELILSGQLSLMDSIGLDTIYIASKNYIKLIDELDQKDYLPLTNGLGKIIENGCLGNKNGKGLLDEENIPWCRVKADMHPRIPFNLILINNCFMLIERGIISIDELDMVFNLVFMSDIKFSDFVRSINFEESKNLLEKIFKKENISYFKPSLIWNQGIF